MAFRLLLVDDDAANLITLEALLEAEGFDVHTASSTPQAGDVLAGSTFDVVVADYRLDGSGCEPLLDLVEATLPKAKVIVLSGDPPDHLSTRVSALVPKGERFEVLLGKIRSALNGR